MQRPQSPFQGSGARLDDHVLFAQVSGTNSAVNGERTSGIYEEISEVHMDLPREAVYEEVLNMATNYPSVQDGVAEESHCEMSPTS